MLHNKWQKGNSKVGMIESYVTKSNSNCGRSVATLSDEWRIIGASVWPAIKLVSFLVDIVDPFLLCPSVTVTFLWIPLDSLYFWYLQDLRDWIIEMSKPSCKDAAQKCGEMSTS